jgi:hypothetical protein
VFSLLISVRVLRHSPLYDDCLHCTIVSKSAAPNYLFQCQKQIIVARRRVSFGVIVVSTGVIAVSIGVIVVSIGVIAVSIGALVTK